MGGPSAIAMRMARMRKQRPFTVVAPKGAAPNVTLSCALPDAWSFKAQMRLERLPTFRCDINCARRGRTLKPSEVASSRQELRSERASKMVFTFSPVEALAATPWRPGVILATSSPRRPNHFGAAWPDDEGLSVSLSEVATAEHRLGDSDAKAPGEMVVAAARETKALRRSIGRSATRGLAGPTEARCSSKETTRGSASRQ